MKQAVELLSSERRVALAASIQHMHMLDAAKQILEDSGKTVLIGRPSGWLKYPGQVLGCDYASVMAVADEAEAIVVISGGDFHALGIPLATRKRTIVVDPFQQKARDLTELVAKILRQRYATITKFREAKRIGVVAGLKSAQMNLALARRLRQLLEDSGKETILLSASEIVPENLESFVDLEAFVEIGCPRISIDDRQRYRKPILNPEEVMIALGKKAWDEYGLAVVPGQFH
jgi:2-(3-amino-3-carboxypropyl)histidine synthase